MTEPDAPIPAPSQNVDADPEPVGQDVTANPQSDDQDVAPESNGQEAAVNLEPDAQDVDAEPEPDGQDVQPEAELSRESVDDMLRRMATLRRRYERARNRGEFPGRAVIATTELPDGTLTFHLAVESKIHEHPLRALESLAICAATLAGNRRKLRKFYVPCLDCKTPIRRSQVILARDQRCRVCRARLQRERRRRKLQTQTEAGQETDSGQTGRTEGKRGGSGKRRS
jgi:hypothetical protein